MEGRHTISDPRETTINGCSWEVDIYREGVDEPIDTIIISDETLPPRKNKRGKIVWRLPTEEGKLPSFGTDERRRIMNLFKERKKTRRKKGNCIFKRESVSQKDSIDAPNNFSQQRYLSYDENDVGKPFNSLVLSMSNKNNTFVNSDSLAEPLGENKCQVFMNAVLPTATSENSTMRNDHNVRKGTEVRTSQISSPNIITPNCVTESREIKNNNTVKKLIDVKTKNIISKPPGFEGINLPSTPPGFHFAVPFHDNKIETEVSINHRPITSLYDYSQPRNEIHKSNKSIDASNKMRYISLQEKYHQERLNISSCLILSQQTKQEQLLNRSSLVVDAAKAFVDLYYPHITNGQSADLALYYTPHAQRSVSVGGAHSVVTGRKDIILQISSLAGTNFLVRGVVVQDTYDFVGAHILVTGMAYTVSLGDNHSITAFAHSISLTPVKIPYYFQIHNDALSLMT